MTPTPEGFINTSDMWQPEEAEDIKDFDAAVKSNEETVPWEEVRKDLGIEIDLPELS